MSKRKIGSEASHVRNRNKTKKDNPAIDADIQNLLGRKLCETYRALVEEKVPTRFIDLLKELKEKEEEDEKEREDQEGGL